MVRTENSNVVIGKDLAKGPQMYKHQGGDGRSSNMTKGKEGVTIYQNTGNEIVEVSVTYGKCKYLHLI